MERQKATVTIITPTKDPENLTPVERWEVVNAAALATRVAIEQYIPAQQREAACDAVERIIRSDAPADIRFHDHPVEIDYDETEVRTNG